MTTIVDERAALIRQAAETIIKTLKEKPETVITMAAGRTMLPLWNLLGEAVRNGQCSFSKATFFQTCEFIQVPENNSLRRMTEDKLLSETDLDPKRCFWISEGNLEDYDRMIQEAGGLDLAVLGIGDNAHIGFNEPATQYDTRCRVQRLTQKTRAQFAWMFGSAEAVPERACTMGSHTLVEAKKIIVLALGEEKDKATFDMLYARDDGIIPAAFLQLPYDVTVFADREAGQKL